MSNPEWLSQVQETPGLVTPAEGTSETGAALAAIAASMDVEAEDRFAAGEVVGVIIGRGAGAKHVLMVSSGSAKVDLARLAQMHGVAGADVSLISAAVLLTEHYQGVATCAAVI